MIKTLRFYLACPWWITGAILKMVGGGIGELIMIVGDWIYNGRRYR